MTNTTTPTHCAVTVSAATEADALAQVERRLPDGFRATGRTGTRSERHLLRTVEVEILGGDRNDCWVVLTSYGMSPDSTLGHTWTDLD